MKFLLLADLHAHNYQRFSTRLENGRNSRLQDCLDILAQVKQVAQDEEIDHLFFLGDLFHSRTKIDIDVYSAVYDAFRSLCLAINQTFFLVGNHDQYSKIGNVHSLTAFRDLRGAEVIDMPSGLSLSGHKITAFPYMEDVQKLKEHLKDLVQDDMLVLLHQGITEAAIGPCDYHAKAELCFADLPFDRCKRIVAGHYHKGQSLHDGQLVYVGSPLQLTFGERTETKGFAVYDTDTNEMIFHESNAPRFLQFEGAKEYLAWKEQDLPGRFFIKVVGPRLEVDPLKEANPDIEIEITDAQSEAMSRVDASVTMDDTKLLTEYVKIRNPVDLDPARLLKYGVDLLSDKAD